jgi:hypothetical protein
MSVFAGNSPTPILLLMENPDSLLLSALICGKKEGIEG